VGKVLLFWSALAVPSPDLGRFDLLESEELARQTWQVELFRILAVIGVVNAAIAGWYYLRITAVMFLREPLQPIAPPRVTAARAAIWACATITLLFGVWPQPLQTAARRAAPTPAEARAAVSDDPARAVVDLAEDP
jgi:hypothetical protein